MLACLFPFYTSYDEKILLAGTDFSPNNVIAPLILIVGVTDMFNLMLKGRTHVFAARLHCSFYAKYYVYRAPSAQKMFTDGLASQNEGSNRDKI